MAKVPRRKFNIVRIDLTMGRTCQDLLMANFKDDTAFIKGASNLLEIAICFSCSIIFHISNITSIGVF